MPIINDAFPLRRIRGKAYEAMWFLFRAIVIIGTSFIIIGPLIKCISNAIKDKGDTYNPLVYLIPANLTLDNFRIAIIGMDYFRSLAYTLVIVGTIMIVQVIVSSFVGYGFARFDFPLKNILFGIVILTIVVPVTTIMMPLYMQFRYFDPLGIFSLLGIIKPSLIDTPLPMILLSGTGVGIRSGLFIFIFRQFFRGLPKEMEESSMIDGLGSYRTYFYIMLPNTIPAMVTVMLFTFVWQYNDTFYTTLLMTSKNFIALKLSALANQLHSLYLMRDANHFELLRDAGILMTIMPLIMLYAVMQRYFIEGIERSGIVG